MMYDSILPHNTADVSIHYLLGETRNLGTNIWKNMFFFLRGNAPVYFSGMFAYDHRLNAVLTALGLQNPSNRDPVSDQIFI